MFTQMLSQISILLLMVFIGVLARFTKILTEPVTRDLNKLIIGLTLPILYFYVLIEQTSREILFSSWYLPFLAVGIVLGGFFLARLYTKLVSIPPEQEKSFLYLSSFTNCGFLSIPLALFLLGEEGMVRVVIFNLGFSVLIWTLGVSILGGKKKVKLIFKNLFNAGTVALVLGFIGVIAGLKLPYVVSGALGPIGKLTIPLAMLLIGGILAGREIHKKIEFKLIVPLILIRLVIIPFLALVIGKLLVFPPFIQSVFVLQAAMPSASTTPIFVQRYGGEAELAGSGVFFTHIISIVTVPFWISLI